MDNQQQKNTGIIILAAGGSTRLGKPKQLLIYKEKTLLNIVSDAALGTSLRPVVAVLGASSEEIRSAHQNRFIDYVVNPNWQLGMSSSIATGLTTLLNKEPSLENVIITVADQVFISSQLLEKLHTKQQVTGKGIIASTYSQTMGTPALFNKKYFQQLLALSGDSGAKSIFKLFPADIETVAFNKGAIDIDTASDYQNLTRSS